MARNPKQTGLKKGGRSTPAKNDVEAAAAAVPAMRISYRRDARRVPGMGQPVVNDRPDPSALKRRIALPLMARNQQQNPLASDGRPLQRTVNRVPRPVEGVTMEVEHPIGLNSSGAQAAVPAAVQGRCLKIFSPFRWRFYRPRSWHPPPWFDAGDRQFGNRRRVRWIARERPDRRRHLCPERSLLSGQAAHVQSRL